MRVPATLAAVSLVHTYHGPPLMPSPSQEGHREHCLERRSEHDLPSECVLMQSCGGGGGY